jgi:tight adherence protein B
MNLILANVFVAVLLSVLALHSAVRWRVLGSEKRVKDRLAALERSDAEGSGEAAPILRTDELSHIPFLDRILRNVEIARDLQHTISQSGVSMTAAGLMLIMLVCGELALVLSLLLGNPFISAASFLVCGSLPFLYILHRRAQRMRRFSEQFPDAIDMMTSALRAGHALGRAMQLVAMEAPEPIKAEFRKTFEEQNLGLPAREALMNLADRIDNVDLKLFVAAIIIQRESGGNLAEILTKISGTIRARFALLGQIRVYTAQARFTAWVLGVLPLAIAGIIYVVSPDYIKFLVKDPAGKAMLGLAVFLQIVGYFTIRRIVKMKVY